jgi:hypothetical protein
LSFTLVVLNFRMKLTNFIFLFITVEPVVWSFMEVVPGEKIELCSKFSVDDQMDISEMKIIMESDNDFFLNGTLIFLRPIRSPWKLVVIGERFERGAWVPGVEKKIANYCNNMRSSLQPGYPFVKDQKPCPLEAGVSNH